MFVVKPTPKQLSKLGVSSNSTSFQVPDQWKDFAPMLTIRSGKSYVPFDPFPYQVQISDLIDVNPYTLVVKGRQLGLSETIISKFLHWALQNPAFAGLVVSKTLQDAMALAKRLRAMVESLEGVKLATESLSEVAIAGGGKIFFRAPGDGSGRGIESVNAILLDEFAWLPPEKQELTFTAAMPSTELLDGAERVIVVSTPRGRSNFYYELLSQCNGNVDVMSLIQQVRNGTAPPFVHFKDESDWLKAIVHWRAHPVFSKYPDYLDRVRKRKKLSIRQVEQEYDLSFETADNAFFDFALILQCANGRFEPPREGVKYYCGLDSSSSGDDYLVFIVAGWINGVLSVVAMHRDRKRNMERHISRIGALIERYQPIVGCIETNGIGALYNERLQQDFPDVNWEAKHTSKDSKLRMLERLHTYMENGQISYPAGIVAEELEALQIDGEKIQAAKGHHDDTVIALALAVEAYETRPKRRIDVSRIQISAASEG